MLCLHTVNDAVSVLSTSHSNAVNEDVSFGTDYGKRKEFLLIMDQKLNVRKSDIFLHYFDALVESLFLLIIFVALVRVQFDIVENQFRFDLYHVFLARQILLKRPHLDYILFA